MTNRTVASEWEEGRGRYRGALFGLAVGDALGTTVEFAAPGSFAPVTDIVGGGPFRLPAGAWTDDTSMALCLADSLLAREAFDPADQLTRYVAWYRDGVRSSLGRCFDIGNATREALHHFERTGAHYPGDVAPNAGGNGVLMKLAPVPMAYAAHPEAAITLAADSARTTHGLPAAVDAARYLAALLIDAIYGAGRDAVAGGEGPLPRRLCEPAARCIPRCRRSPTGRTGGNGRLRSTAARTPSRPWKRRCGHCTPPTTTRPGPSRR